MTLTTRVSYPITGELFPVHFNIHASFTCFVSSKLQLNLHLRQVAISRKTAACSPKIFTIASRACPHKLIDYPTTLFNLSYFLKGLSLDFPIVHKIPGFTKEIIILLGVSPQIFQRSNPRCYIFRRVVRRAASCVGRIQGFGWNG